MPKEVLGWNDILQERYCIEVGYCTDAGMGWEESIREAIEETKKSEDFKLFYKSS